MNKRYKEIQICPKCRKAVHTKRAKYPTKGNKNRICFNCAKVAEERAEENKEYKIQLRKMRGLS